jgi:hypothetical protein
MGSTLPLSTDLIPVSSDHPDENTGDIDHISNLPTELLSLIIEQLPVAIFQEDVGRLAISKRWYGVAQPLFLPRMEFTPRIIDRMANTETEVLSESLAPFRNSAGCANIVLEGGDPDLVPLNTSTNLFHLFSVLDEHTDIAALRLVARRDNNEWVADPRPERGYLYLHGVFMLLDLKHLTSLDLDLCGTNVKCPCEVPLHFCCFVRKLLSKVQTLRLRMRRICHEALWPLEDRPVTLRKLTVNLYLGDLSDHNPKLNSSRRCVYQSPSRWGNPMNELRARMRALVEQMPGPRRAEIRHLALSGEMHVWDALTGACVRDESEEPKQFPLWLQTQSRRPCFHRNADNWEWDDEAEVGRIPGHEDHSSEFGELAEEDEPSGVGEVKDAKDEE